MNKYFAKKTRVSEKVFDSKKEAKRYLELQELLRLGKISNLETQKEFELIPKQVIGKRVVERSCKYRCDFCYYENGELVVEDVKSKMTKKRPEYIIKRKLMLYLKNIRIKEV